MASLEARIRAIEGVNLYDPVRAAEMCLVPNVVYQRNFEFLNLSNIPELNALLPISNLIAIKWQKWCTMRSY
jgi:hypothetical protein